MVNRERTSLYMKSDSPRKEYIAQGLGWIIDLAKTENKTEVLLFVLQNSVLDGVIAEVLGVNVVKALKQGKDVRVNNILSLTLATERKFDRNYPGAVLAIYPTKKLLDIIDDMRQVSDVLVIPLSMEEVQYWIDTWNAQELFGQNKKQLPKEFSDPVVEAPLNSLTSNVNINTVEVTQLREMN